MGPALTLAGCRGELIPRKPQNSFLEYQMLHLQISFGDRWYVTGRPPASRRRRFDRGGLSHVTLMQHQMLRSIRVGMRTSSGCLSGKNGGSHLAKPTRRPPACFIRAAAAGKRGSWEPTSKLWVFQVPQVSRASHLYTIINPERLESLSRPRTPILQTRVANKDLLVSRWASHPP